jgi:hypothetical protein
MDIRGLLAIVVAHDGVRSMQSLMHDQPQPACDRPKNDGSERGERDHIDGNRRLVFGE